MDTLSYKEAEFNPYHINSPVLKNLLETPYESQSALIGDFLYPGLYILAGEPKIGKSFLVEQIAFHVATGKDFWRMKTKQGMVLYLALDDNYSRLKTRMFNMFGGEGSDKLYFAIEVNTLGNGLEEQLDNFIKEHNECRLIIIDPFQKILCSENNSYSYENDYAAILKLKKFADSHGICVLLVHYTKEIQSDDHLGKISGDKSLMEAIDGKMVLTKESRLGLRAILEVLGRDQQNMKFNIIKDPKTMIWNLVDVETGMWKDEIDSLILKLAEKVHGVGEWSGTATELIEFLDENIAPNSLSKKLNVNASVLKNELRISYKNTKNHQGRKITLKVIETENKVSDNTTEIPVAAKNATYVTQEEGEENNE